MSAGARGASLVQYLVVVAIILGIVALGVTRFSSAVRTAATCQGSDVASLGGGAAGAPCGGGKPTAPSASPTGGGASSRAAAIAGQPGQAGQPGGLTCDALGCRTSGAASGTAGTGKTPAPAAPPAEPKTNYDDVRNGVIAGTPFVTGKDQDRAVHPADVSQGQIADCYFLASLATMASTHPEVLQRNLTTVGKDRYAVRLFVKGKWTTVDLDNQFPVAVNRWNKRSKEFSWYENAGGVYAKGGTSEQGTELWPMLYEKAFAQASGGWNAMGNGGSAGDVLTALTGVPSLSTDADKISFETFAGYVNSGYAVVGGTLPHPPEGAPEQHELFKNDTVAHWHSYWVRSVDVKAKTVTIGNPWGWEDKGIVLTWEQYRAVMSTVYANPVKPVAPAAPVAARKKKWRWSPW